MSAILHPRFCIKDKLEEDQPMDDKLVRQVFEELLPSLEALDTKCAAILQFLKNKGIANDDELAPYFEEAGNASNVRWRAARVRINHLLSTTQAAEQDKGTSSSQSPEKKSEPTVVKKSTDTEGGKAEKDKGDVQKTTDAHAEVASNTDHQRKVDQEESKAAGREQKDGQTTRA
jgi:hypothetical protein